MALGQTEPQRCGVAILNARRLPEDAHGGITRRSTRDNDRFEINRGQGRDRIPQKCTFHGAIKYQTAARLGQNTRIIKRNPINDTAAINANLPGIIHDIPVRICTKEAI